eukprot:scaffold118_cov382-Prasinococcus_capsulatus_cf.AAC.2
MPSVAWIIQCPAGNLGGADSPQLRCPRRSADCYTLASRTRAPPPCLCGIAARAAASPPLARQHSPRAYAVCSARPSRSPPRSPLRLPWSGRGAMATDETAPPEDREGAYDQAAVLYPSSYWKYDLLVYGINCRFGWGIRYSHIVSQYQAFASNSPSHCEVGLASPTFVRKSVPLDAQASPALYRRARALPPLSVATDSEMHTLQLHLLDVHQGWLDHAAVTLREIGYTSVTTELMDITEGRQGTYTSPGRHWPPLCHTTVPKPCLSSARAGVTSDVGCQKHGALGVKTLGVNFVFHCIPGPFREKGVGFQHLKALLADDGVLFGSTILGDSMPHTWFGRRVMRRFNANGIFSNAQDELSELYEALGASFKRVRIKVVGVTAIFAATDCDTIPMKPLYDALPGIPLTKDAPAP